MDLNRIFQEDTECTDAEQSSARTRYSLIQTLRRLIGGNDLPEVAGPSDLYDRVIGGYFDEKRRVTEVDEQKAAIFERMQLREGPFLGLVQAMITKAHPKNEFSLPYEDEHRRFYSEHSRSELVCVDRISKDRSCYVFVEQCRQSDKPVDAMAADYAFVACYGTVMEKSDYNRLGLQDQGNIQHLGYSLSNEPVYGVIVDKEYFGISSRDLSLDYRKRSVQDVLNYEAALTASLTPARVTLVHIRDILRTRNDGSLNPVGSNGILSLISEYESAESVRKDVDPGDYQI